MKKKKGVLTIEAALVVPIFVFSIYFLVDLMQIISVHDSVQSNIYTTAKFINGYTYLTTSSGLTDFVDDNNTPIDAGETIVAVQNIFKENIVNEEE